MTSIASLSGDAAPGPNVTIERGDLRREVSAPGAARCRLDDVVALAPLVRARSLARPAGLVERIVCEVTEQGEAN